MTYPQQSTPRARSNAPTPNAPTTEKQAAGAVDTVYLDAEVIEPNARDSATRMQTRQGSDGSFVSFTWSSLDGFQRGWNGAYSDKQGNDPFMTDMPANGPKTSKAEWKRGNVTSGLLQTLAGGAIALVGVPMLILPGPGLLAIGLGGALAASGVRKMLGK